MKSTERRSTRLPTVIHCPHEPHLRQRHFPTGTKLSRPSTRPERRHVAKAAHQSTLTQLQYVTSSFGSRHTDSEAEDSDFGGPIKKRRRMNPSRKEVEDGPQQATLTQIGWPHDFLSDGEEHDEGAEYSSGNEESDAGEVGQGVDLQNTAETTNGGCVDRKNENETENMATKVKGPESPHAERVDDSTNRRSPSCVKPTDPVFKTPPRPIRFEVPSSQSPDATPIKETDTPVASERTPLQEIPENILAQRDATPTPSPRKQRIMQDSDDITGSSADDKENYDLESSNNPPDKSYLPSSSTCFTPAKPEDAASPPDEFTPDFTFKTPTARLSEPSPSPSPSPRPRSFRKVNFVARSTGNQQPAQAPNSNYVRPSQATTVDPTQPTPKRSQATPSSSAVRMTDQFNRGVSRDWPHSSPRPLDTFPFSAFSVFTEDGDPEIPLGASLRSQFSDLPDSSAEM